MFPSCSLFSVRRVEQEDMTVTFVNGNVSIVKNNQVLATGTRTLYKLDVYFPSCEQNAMVAKTDDFAL